MSLPVSTTFAPDENRRFAIEALRDADGVFVVSGAGMSVDSGLPDFRGKGGLWRGLEEARHLGHPAAFKTDPKGAWGFYAARLAQSQEAIPHPGYFALHSLIAGKRLGGFVLTSNVDGLHRKAGWSGESFNECHGRLDRAQCSIPCHRAQWALEAKDLVVKAQRLISPAPVCPACGAVARPAVNMFGDGAWIDDEVMSADERLATWLATARGAKIAVLEVGAGTKLPFIRRNAEIVAGELGVPVIRINLCEPTPGPGIIPLALGAEDVLVAIARQLEA